MVARQCDQAAAVVSSFVVDAGVIGRSGSCDQSTVPVAASVTEPVNAPSPGFVTAGPSAVASRWEWEREPTR